MRCVAFCTSAHVSRSFVSASRSPRLTLSWNVSDSFCCPTALSVTHKTTTPTAPSTRIRDMISPLFADRRHGKASETASRYQDFAGQPVILNRSCENFQFRSPGRYTPTQRGQIPFLATRLFFGQTRLRKPNGVRRKDRVHAADAVDDLGDPQVDDEARQPEGRLGRQRELLGHQLEHLLRRLGPGFVHV